MNSLKYSTFSEVYFDNQNEQKDQYHAFLEYELFIVNFLQQSKSLDHRGSEESDLYSVEHVIWDSIYQLARNLLARASFVNVDILGVDIIGGLN
jgi:hypothetical protein